MKPVVADVCCLKIDDITVDDAVVFYLPNVTEVTATVDGSHESAVLSGFQVVECALGFGLREDYSSLNVINRKKGNLLDWRNKAGHDQKTRRRKPLGMKTVSLRTEKTRTHHRQVKTVQ